MATNKSTATADKTQPVKPAAKTAANPAPRRTTGQVDSPDGSQLLVAPDHTGELDELRELKIKTKKIKENADDDAWRHNYPYDTKLSRSSYEKKKRAMQIELLKMKLYRRC